jgi:uncharacterized protein YodC (DUF2158 family)
MSDNKIKDGGPAFACASDNGMQEGMLLRDWFAGQYLSGHIARYGESDTPQSVAENAYLYADAMIVERSKEPGDDQN